MALSEKMLHPPKQRQCPSNASVGSITFAIVAVCCCFECNSLSVRCGILKLHCSQNLGEADLGMMLVFVTCFTTLAFCTFEAGIVKECKR